MPGLDNTGLDLGRYGFGDPHERGNVLASHAGGAIWIGSHIAAGKRVGFGGLATRQGKAATKKLADAATLRANLTGGAKGIPGLAAAEANLGVASTMEAKAASLKAKGAANKVWAKKLGRVGTAYGIMTTIAFGFELGKAMMNVGGEYRIRKEDLAEQRRKVYNDDTFMDSRAAFTQRQRAIQVIHNSQMGVRSAMGSEASYLHY